MADAEQAKQKVKEARARLAAAQSEVARVKVELRDVFIATIQAVCQEAGFSIRPFGSEGARIVVEEDESGWFEFDG